MNNEYLTTFLIFISLVVFGFFVDFLAKNMKPDLKGDTGYFWFANFLFSLFGFFLFSILYFLITFQLFGSYEIYKENHYAFANGLLKLNINENDILWANIFSIFWITSIFITLFLPKKIFHSIKKSSWHKAMIGTLSSNVENRRWILFLLIPISLALLLPLPNIWNNFNFYPFFIFNAGLVFFVIIVMISLSKPSQLQKGEKSDSNSANIVANTAQKLWPEQLEEGGVNITYLGMIEKTKIEHSFNGNQTKLGDFTLRANTFLKNGGAIELLEAVEDILTPGGDIRKRHKQIRAQDSCGQLESVAIAAEALFLRYYTITLWIVPEQQVLNIQEQLNQFFNENSNGDYSSRVYVLTTDAPYPDNDTSMILLTDAKTLSDSFMDTLVANKLILQSIGMVIWWDLHEYTGVLAGNMWAIVHRIHRLIELKGRNDSRVMAFLRQAHNAEANLGRFVQGLLPFEFHPESIIDIPVTQSHLTYLYQLDSIEPSAISPTPNKIHQHVLLYAARASIIAGWDTSIIAPSACLSLEEINTFLSRKEHIYSYEYEKKLKSHIPNSSANAQALILQLDSKNALAIAELIASLGRVNGNELQYVGVLTNGNCYINFILKQYCNKGREVFTSQALLIPKPNEEIISRHLKKALYETASTQSDMKTDFQFENEFIEKILKEIKKEGNLRTSEVRYLVNDGLKVEPEYKSIAGRADHSSAPLDTNTSDLINIIAPALGTENEGIRFKIDSHRVTVLAYPGCVFYHSGRRFEIPLNNLTEWQRWETMGEIYCHSTDRKVRTLRLRVPSLYECIRIGDNIVTETIRYFLIKLDYEESIEGYISKSTVYSEKQATTDIQRFKDLFSKRFSTKARCIELLNTNYDAIVSIAEALYYVLPIHLGVDENTFEIIAVKDLDINGEYFTGITIIELYSTGIGLVEMLDMTILPKIFEGIQHWLEDCTCSDGCENCLLGEEKRYPANQYTISKQEALKALANLVKL